MVKADFALQLTEKDLILHGMLFPSFSDVDLQFSKKELV